MKFYVTMERKELITYEVEASNREHALELGHYLAWIGAPPDDTTDAVITPDSMACISHFDFLLEKREDETQT
jgi:hypothetical protein